MVVMGARAVPSQLAPRPAPPPCAPQATTNSLLAHFFSLVSSLWLLRIVANRPSTAQILANAGSSSAAPARAAT